MEQSVIIPLVCIISLIHYSVAEWNDANWIDFPFMVSLRYPSGSPLCGGSILTLSGHNGKGAILTAAHCTGEGRNTLIKIGCSTTSCPSSESPSTYNVESVANHPEWDGSVGTGDDIAILYLTSAITHPNAEAVVLESNVDIIENDDEIVLVGYGGAHVSDTDTLETAISHVHDGGDYCVDDLGILCVFDDGGSDNLQSTLCFGDSGSPMMREGKQAGVVSFVFGQCVTTRHQGGALVPIYYDWVFEECGQDCNEEQMDLPNTSTTTSTTTTTTTSTTTSPTLEGIETLSLYRYWNADTADHLYTTDYEELGDGTPEWSLQGIECEIVPVGSSGASELHRYYNRFIGDHFYTTDLGERGDGGRRWRKEESPGACFSSSTARVGLVPLYRYRARGRNRDYFYTTDATEIGGNVYRFQGIECYVHPYTGSGAVVRSHVDDPIGGGDYYNLSFANSSLFSVIVCVIGGLLIVNIIMMGYTYCCKSSSSAKVLYQKVYMDSDTDV